MQRFVLRHQLLINIFFRHWSPANRSALFRCPGFFYFIHFFLVFARGFRQNTGPDFPKCLTLTNFMHFIMFIAFAYILEKMDFLHFMENMLNLLGIYHPFSMWENCSLDGWKRFQSLRRGSGITHHGRWWLVPMPSILSTPSPLAPRE